MKFRWDKKYLLWGVTAFLVIAGGISFYYLLFHSNSLKSNLFKLISIAMPVIDGLILAYLLCPVVNFLERKFLHPLRDKLIQKYPFWKEKQKKLTGYCRAVSIVLTLLLVIYTVFGFFRFVIPQIAASIQNIISQFPTYVNNLLVWLEKILAANPEIEQTVTGLIDTYSKDLEAWLNRTVLPQMNAILKTVSLSMIGIAKAVWNLVIGLIISIYLMVNKERFISQLKKMIYAFLEVSRANALIDDVRLIDRTFGGFINGKILDSIIIGVICFICVSFMKLPYPMLISVIVGVTNIIPFFGPFIGAVPCALLILMVNPLQCLYFIIFILILQQFDGNFLGPKILGSSTGLSSFWVIFSITIFNGLMGVAGMILGVPIFAVIYALLRRKINRDLYKKGMPTDTAMYHNLSRVETTTGEFLENEPQDSTARNAGQASSRSILNWLKAKAEKMLKK